MESSDVVVVGGGHNGLAAAAYLGRAGRGVVVLERSGHVGGAAVSERPFAGVDARLSRYSYLVSLLPHAVSADLGLGVELARRRYSSYTPDPDAPERGLLVDHGDPEATAASFARLGAAADAAAWDRFYGDAGRLARAVFPTVTEPLPARSALRARLGDDALWDELVERPLGESVTSRFRDDLVRGVVATDGLIGTLTGLFDPALDANRCFLYHVIGNGTGDWDVPVGGMGAVSGALERVARAAGAEIRTGAEVVAIEPGDGVVRYRLDGEEREVRAGHVLANVAPWTLRGLLGEPRGERPEGAQVKVNLLLRRLPRLRDESVAPEAAFGGTFHVRETLTQLEDAYRLAAGGEVPDRLPCEIYCHSITDPSILGPELAASGAHTLTVFGLHVPGRAITAETNDAWRERLGAAVLASLGSVLAEPIEDVLHADADGAPCIEVRTTLDVERSVGMPGGNIFHGPLSWPFLEDAETPDSPAARWGVATGHDRVLLCGSGARRGGAVSALGGHNAAMALLGE